MKAADCLWSGTTRFADTDTVPAFIAIVADVAKRLYASAYAQLCVGTYSPACVS